MRRQKAEITKRALKLDTHVGKRIGQVTNPEEDELVMRHIVRENVGITDADIWDLDEYYEVLFF